MVVKININYKIGLCQSSNQDWLQLFSAKRKYVYNMYVSLCVLYHIVTYFPTGIRGGTPLPLSLFVFALSAVLLKVIIIVIPAVNGK